MHNYSAIGFLGVVRMRCVLKNDMKYIKGMFGWEVKIG